MIILGGMGRMDIVQLLLSAIAIYVGLGLIFFSFVLAYAAIHKIRLPGEDYGYALVGAILFWPKLLKWFLTKR